MAPLKSENGWEPPWVGQDRLNWVDIPGCNVQVQTQKGLPTALIRAWIADHNAYIEPVRNGDTASYTPTNSVSTSNHLNGTAADVNWNTHPFHARGTFTPQQMKTLREMLAFYTHQGVQMIFWAGDWNDPIDEMHVQLGYDTYDNQDIVKDFVAKKIRADGFSTFRRGNAPVAAPAADVLARATGLSLARAAEILPAVRDGLKESECTNSKRIAMWLAQIGHESGSFQYTEEIDKTGRYAPYIGRTWIQITWDYNYSSFSLWCNRRGLVPTPDYFVQHPNELADLRWAGLGAAWYWTVQRSNINTKADEGDLLAVTRMINGGTNGIADRNDRYKRARDLGDQLLLLLDTQQHEQTIEELLMADGRYSSWSIYKTPGEGDIPLVDMIRAIDAREHERATHEGALAGYQDDIHRVFRTAAGQGEFKDAKAVNRAKSVIAELKKTNLDALNAYLASKGIA